MGETPTLKPTPDCYPRLVLANFTTVENFRHVDCLANSGMTCTHTFDNRVYMCHYIDIHANFVVIYVESDAMAKNI